MREPGFEPGSSGWKPEILTTELPTLKIISGKCFNKVYSWYPKVNESLNNKEGY